MIFMNMDYNKDNINLDKFDRNAFEHSIQWLSDEYIIKMICAPLSSRSEKEKWFQSLNNKDDYKCWVIKYDKIPIGVCGIKNIDRDTKSGEYFGYIGEDSFRGKGLGNKLMELAKEKSAVLGIKRLYLKVRNDNIPALNLYKKHGFSEVGYQDNFILMQLDLLTTENSVCNNQF